MDNIAISINPDRLMYLDIRGARSVYGGSVAWWRKAVWLKQIPYHKRGSRVVFSRADLDAYFAARRVPARQEAA